MNTVVWTAECFIDVKTDAGEEYRKKSQRK